jgi:hypothetical protein
MGRVIKFDFRSTNLMGLSILKRLYDTTLTRIIPSLTNLPNTLIKLSINVQGMYIPLSFLKRFTNLQEFEITFDNI